MKDTRTGGFTLHSKKPGHWYDDFVFMDKDTKKDFETFAAKKELSEAALAGLKSYIEQHGRLRVLNAVKEIMPDHLDAIMGVERKKPKQ